MILYVNGSVRHPVFDCGKGKYFGRITDILVDDGFKTVLGYVCRTRFFRPRWAFDTSAVRLINKDLMLIDRKGKKWLPLNKAVHEAWRRSKSMPKIKVIEGGKTVGEVADFAFDSETGQVVGVLISRGLLGKLLYIPQSDVVMAGRDGVLVREGSIVDNRPPREAGGLFNGFLKAAARGLGTGVAKARAAVKEHTANSLAGKEAPSEILDSGGRLLAREGERLTPEVIGKLEAADKLSETSLLMAGKNFGAALAAANRRLRKRTGRQQSKPQ
ncbi:MAG: PRC-barrel domain-containing protein [Actinobacteria bacterium]|nr:PRC-barrel domain-containing protein [Actinomycetota bacterium]